VSPLAYRVECRTKLKHMSTVRFTLFFCLFITLAGVTHAQNDSTNWHAIEEVFERPGTIQDQYFKISFPRSDLYVTIDGVQIAPALALTSWFGFMPNGSDVMMMGDLVLTESEVPAVESKLEEQGLQITALHNHLIGESPAVKYVHIEGSGEATTVARKLRSVLALTGTPMTTTMPPSDGTDWSMVESIIGVKGQVKGHVLQMSLPRAQKVTENEMEIPPFLGTATALNFEMIGDKTATTGDFVLIASEVNPVVTALRDNGIIVTAIHNHMFNESPRLFMLHFWAYGALTEVAHGLRTALDRVDLK